VLTRPPGALLLGSDFKALGVARSLGRRGIPVAMVDNLPRAGWFSRYVRRRYRWPGPMSGAAFLDFLLDVGRRGGMQGWVLFPTQDENLELVARNYESLSDFYRLVTQPWSILKWAHDKKLLHVIAEGAGVGHPRTWYPPSENELRTMDIRFPAILKPAISINLQYATGRKALAAANPEALVDAYRRVLAVVPADAVMVQELLIGASQYSVAAFCEGGRVVSAMTARRTRQYPIDFGLSSSFVEAVEAPHLLELAGRLLRRLGMTGMVEVEFIEDPSDGAMKVLDVNARPFGWHTLCIASGLDLPWMQYGYALGRHPRRVLPRYGLRWIRLMTDLPAGAQAVRAGIITPLQYVRSLRGKNVFSVLDVRDPLPAAGDLMIGLFRLLHLVEPRRAHLSGAAGQQVELDVAG
jgi:D-aspartate ligase